MSAAPAAEMAITLTGVSKRYGGVAVIDDLTLKIPRGTTFGLLGPNGAGKTTLIKMMMGLLSVSAGEVRILGRDVFQEPVEVKKQIGYVPEQPSIYRWMRVGEVLGFVKTFHANWNEALCGRLLAMFGLELKKKVKHLSKGTLAKLALLLAIAPEPEVLLLDEPTAGLDPLAREEFLDGVLQVLCEQRRTVLISSHTLVDVHRLADRVGILAGGRLLVQRPTDELLMSTKRLRAVLREENRPGREPAGTIWQRVQGREWLLTVSDFAPEKVQQLRAENAVETIEVQDLGLEELFKDYIRGWRTPA